MSNPALQRLRRFRFNLPQRVAVLLLLCFIGQWTWLDRHTPPTPSDERMATCGAQMWLPDGSPTLPALACGGITDGALAYRLAGLPPALDQMFRHPAIAGFSPAPPAGTQATPARTPPSSTVFAYSLPSSLPDWLLTFVRLPFLLAGLALAACLWWVTRRLFGNAGGYLALSFYCFSPQMLIYSLVPNNEILAACGFFAAFYTAIGVGHALQGPRRKWRKRIVLMTVTLGFTAAAHVSAFWMVLVVSYLPMAWVAEQRRKYLPELTVLWSLGAIFLLGIAQGLHPARVAAAFVDAGRGLRILPQAVPQHLASITTLPLLLLLLASLAIYALSQRSRYFGNTLPLLMLVFLLLVSFSADGSTSATGAVPWMWATPFLLTFVGGIFADAIETRLRWPAIALVSLLLAAQIWTCLHALPLEAWVGLLA